MSIDTQPIQPHLTAKDTKKASSNPDAKLRTQGSFSNPATTHYEFLGPPGALTTVLTLPVLVYFLHYSLDGHFPRVWHEELLDVTAAKYFFAWMAFTAFMYIAPFGRVVEGVQMRDGATLTYRVNALHTFVAVVVLTASTICIQGISPLVKIYDHIPGLITAAIVYSFIQSVALYIWSFRPNDSQKKVMLAIGGNSGNAIYDFFIGRELNPRIFSTFDLKYFCELRPGLMGWMLINAAAAAKQYQEIGHLTDSMILVLIFQGWYVVDSLVNEVCVLTTMDITTDGFGFMLTFGDLAWVPFTYSLQARYLATHPTQLGPALCFAIIALQLTGYWIFRSANGQKDVFRSMPESKEAKSMKFMTTKTGSKLITSGWWGMARHINYLGDWMMGLAWCLPCGIVAFPPIPYFYAIYFAVLLLHRERRDDDKCSKKYGKDWERYKHLVRWRIVPGIY